MNLIVSIGQVRNLTQVIATVMNIFLDENNRNWVNFQVEVKGCLKTRIWSNL